MKNSKDIAYYRSDLEKLRERSLDFITIGVGCNCLITLNETGILNKLISKGYVTEEEVESNENPLSIRGALTTLQKCDVVRKLEQVFLLTEFGIILSEYMGLISIFFDGYGNLIAKQGAIANNKFKNKNKLIKGSSVSNASIHISKNLAESVILNEFQRLKLKGTICDLGCGYATMLSKICEITGNPGLGFDSEFPVVKRAKGRLGKNSNISIECEDISKLSGIWEDVVILMQFHVFHDFTPGKRCVEIMNSYLNNFPNLKCFFYMDTVAPSPLKDKILPGFDYVHGLLGIETRTYEETLQMFAYSNYKILKEIAFPNLPNTFLWLLTPNKKNHS